MMHLPYRPVLMSCLLLLVVTGVGAKEPAGNASPGVAEFVPVGSIDLSVFAIAHAEGLKSVYSVSKDAVPDVIALSTANVTGPYTVGLDARSNVMLWAQQSSGATGAFSKPVARAQLPDGIKEPLMILFPAADRQSYESIIIESSLEDFSFGSYLLINLSAVNIRGQIGDEQVLVAAGDTNLVTPSAPEKESLNVHFEYERQGLFKTFGRTRWTIEQGKRSLLLVYRDARTKRLKIRGVAVK